MKYLIALFYFVYASISFAQTHGHPGGGGPDGNTDEQNILCQHLYDKALELEDEFSKSWHRKNQSSDMFFVLLEDILVEYSLKSIDQMQASDLTLEKKCEQDEVVKPTEGTLAARIHYQKELQLLKSIHSLWSDGKKNMKNMNACQIKFAERSLKAEELKLLIELYEKNGK
jgi:hypothetical protein